MVSLSGGAIVSYWDVDVPNPSGLNIMARPPNIEFRWLPYYAGPQSATMQSGRLVFPLWILVLIGLFCAYRLLPEGYGKGRCAKCGYDLKGVPLEDSGMKCPECGAKEAKCGAR